MKAWLLLGLSAFIIICGFIGFVVKHEWVGIVYLIIGGVFMGAILRYKGWI